MTDTTQVHITPDMTMEQILERVPAAQRALFQRYHVGGCSSCGFQPTDTLAQVCKDHNILDVNDVLRTIQLAHEADQNLQVDPPQVQEWLSAQGDWTLLDVRMPQEWEGDRIEGAELMDYSDSDRYMQLPKDRRIVFYCQTGVRSLDVAAYFKGHGFEHVYSLRGGIEAWRDQVDPTPARP